MAVLIYTSFFVFVFGLRG